MFTPKSLAQLLSRGGGYIPPEEFRGNDQNEESLNSTPLGGHRSTSNGIPAPRPYIGPPRMDMSIQGLRQFMRGQGSQGGMPGGMHGQMNFGAPSPMVNTHSRPSSSSLASNLFATRNAM